MANLNQKPDNGTNASGSGGLTQPDDDLQSVYNYREILEQFWTLFIEVDLGKLESDGKEIKTTESQLRDIIQNLRVFRATPAGKKVQVDNIIGALWDALKDLYQARDLIIIEEKNSKAQIAVTQDNINKYDLFQSFLDSIDRALGILPSRPVTIATAPPATGTSEGDTNLPKIS